MDLLRFSVNELASVCAHSANEAEWREFLRRITPLTSTVVGRVVRVWTNAHSAPPVDDIVQEVFLKLCEQERRILREFEPRGEDSFLALLRVVAVSVANDYFRNLHSQKRGGKAMTAALEADYVPSPAAGHGEPSGLYKTVLFSELDRKLRNAPGVVSERDRRIFWLYYRQGFTAEQIASLPAVGLTTKGVESAVRRVGLWLRDEVKPRPAEQTTSRIRGTELAFAKENSAQTR